MLPAIGTGTEKTTSTPLWMRLPSPKRLRPRRLCGRLLASVSFPGARRTKRRSPNSLERRNGEIKRPADGVGIFPNDGAIRLAQNDERALQRARSRTLEAAARPGGDPIVGLPIMAS